MYEQHAPLTVGNLAARLASPPSLLSHFQDLPFHIRSLTEWNLYPALLLRFFPFFRIKNSMINPERSDGWGQGRFSAAKEKQGGTSQVSGLLPTPCLQLPQTLLTNNIMKIDICSFVMLSAILNVLCLGRNV